MRHARQGLKRDSLGFDVRHCWQIGLRQHEVKNRASRSLAVGGSEPQHARQSSIFDGEGDKLAIDIVGLLRTELSLLAMNIQLALSHQRLTHRLQDPGHHFLLSQPTLNAHQGDQCLVSFMSSTLGKKFVCVHW